MARKQPGHFYYQDANSQAWHPIKETDVDKLQGKAVFVTVLALDKLVLDSMDNEEISKIKRRGPLYFDFDCGDVMQAVQDTKACIETLKKYVPPETLSIFLTGAKGTHVELAQENFTEGDAWTPNLHVVYKNMAYAMAEPSLDLTVYSGRKGRMWRVPNVKRTNGLYKVQVTYAELCAIETIEDYKRFCAAPRGRIEPIAAYSLELASIFSTSSQTAAKPVRKSTTSVGAVEPLIKRLCSGEGSGGFHQKALQVGIYANAAGWALERTLQECKGLIETHVSDGTRYNTETKRSHEIKRMWAYCEDNPAHALAMGPVRKLLASEDSFDPFPAEDAPKEKESSIYINDAGVFVTGENGDQNIFAGKISDFTMSFSAETGDIQNVSFVLANPDSKRVASILTSPDAFISSSSFNRVMLKQGIPFTGTDLHAKLLYAKLMGTAMNQGERYSTSKEGLQLMRLTSSADPRAREGFLVWASRHSTVMPDDMAQSGVEVIFEGFPDALGVFKTDIANARDLADWAQHDKEEAARLFHAWSKSHIPGVVAPVIGWHIASFFRPLFHEVYEKFPLLHIAGAAGCGKCLGAGTPVIMADFSIKKVEDVRNGDKVLSPTGGERLVSGVCSGISTLWKVEQEGGMSYVCNDAHILSLKHKVSRETLNINVALLSESPDLLRTYAGWRPQYFSQESGAWAASDGHDLMDVKLTRLEQGQYYGFQLDGDHLFMLGDGTVTHNTDTTLLTSRLFYQEAETFRTSPLATTFALEAAVAASCSIPVYLDEYKPHEMRAELHDKLKSLFRNIYNCMNVQRGGGNRSSDNFMALSSMSLSAPVCFIAEAMEEEPAVLERVVLASFAKPSLQQYQANLANYLDIRDNAHLLSSLGKYIILDVVSNWDRARLQQEFGDIHNSVNQAHAATREFMATDYSPQELARRQGNKPRTIYNYAVALFGLRYLQSTLEELFGAQASEGFAELEAPLFSRLTDLSTGTQAEWLKLFNVWADMSYFAMGTTFQLRKGVDYDFMQVAGADCVVVNARSCYSKYRAYMGSLRSKPLYPGEFALTHALKDVPAVIDTDWRQSRLPMAGGAVLMDAQELASQGFRGFKE